MPTIKTKGRYPQKNWQKWYGCTICGGEWTGDSDAVGVTEKQGFGMKYPESETVVGDDGQRYCLAHYKAKYYIKHLREAEVNIDEDRGDEIDFD